MRSLLAGSSGLLNEHSLDIDLLDVASLGAEQALRGPLTGTKALMLAVLDNAITCYLSRAPRIRTEAEHWFASSEHHSPFSFTVLCDTLGLEPSAVRRALERLRTEGGGHRPGTSRRRLNVRRQGRLVVPKNS